MRSGWRGHSAWELGWEVARVEMKPGSRVFTSEAELSSTEWPNHHSGETQDINSLSISKYGQAVCKGVSPGSIYSIPQKRDIEGA